MKKDASKKKDGDGEAEALWYEYLGDWSKLRRKNIHAAVLALAAVRAKISKSTTIVSDLLLHGFFHASDIDTLEKRKQKCKHIRDFLKQTDFRIFRQLQQENLKSSLTIYQMEMQNELWYNALDEKRKRLFPWVYPKSRLNVITSKTSKAEMEQMKIPPKFNYVLPGYDKDGKTEDEQTIGFSVERIGTKGNAKKQLFCPTGIAILNTGHMNANHLRFDKGFICKIFITDSGNNRVQLWTYQCSPYFPKTLEEKGGFEEIVIFEKMIGTSPQVPTHAVARALDDIEREGTVSETLQMNSPDKLKHVAREEKNYNTIKQWEHNSKLQNTHGYHRGQFTSPQYVSIDKRGCVQISDNNSKQIGSPRVQVFSIKDNFTDPFECIDNNTDILGITRRQANLYVDENSQPLRRETDDNFLFLNVNGKSSREKHFSDYFHVGAKVGGKRMKGIAWTFPRAKRPFDLEIILKQNLQYTEHKKIKEAFDCLNNEGNEFMVGETEKAMQGKIALLDKLIKNDIIHGSWLTLDEITIVNENVFNTESIQNGDTKNPYIFYILSLPPMVAKKVFMEAFEKHKENESEKKDNDDDDDSNDENDSNDDSGEDEDIVPMQGMDNTKMILPNFPEYTISLTVEIAPVLQLNNKSFFKINCVIKKSKVKQTPEDDSADTPNLLKNDLKEEMIYHLHQTIIESTNFQEMQRKRLDDLWVFWNNNRSPKVSISKKIKMRLSKKNDASTGSSVVNYLEFDNVTEYEAWKQKQEKRYKREKKYYEQQFRNENEATRKKLVKNALKSVDNGKKIWKKPVEIKIKKVKNLEEHKKLVKSEINALKKELTNELLIVETQIAKNEAEMQLSERQSVANQLNKNKHNRDCILSSQHILKEIETQQRSKNLFPFLQKCIADYKLEVLDISKDEKNDIIFDTHLHIYASVMVFKIVATQNFKFEENCEKKDICLKIGELFDTYFEEKLYLAGVVLLTKSIQRCISGQVEQSKSNSFFFVPINKANKKIHGIQKPFLLPYESIIARSVQGHVKLLTGKSVWVEGDIIAIDRETGLYIFRFLTSDEKYQVRLLPRNDLRDSVPTYQPVFKRPWGSALLDTFSINVLAVADHDQNCIHFFNNHDDHKLRNAVDCHRNSYLYTIGSTGKNKGELRRPKGMAFDSFGRLLVADSENHRIQGFRHLKDPTGKTQGKWVVEIMHPEQPCPGEATSLHNPSDITVDSYDHYIVADTGHHCIKIFHRVVDYGPYELKDLRDIEKVDSWQYESRPNGKVRRRIPRIYLECLCTWGTQGHELGSMIEPISVACVTVPAQVKTVKCNKCNGVDPDEKFDEERIFVCDRSLHCVHIFKYTAGYTVLQQEQKTKLAVEKLEIKSMHTMMK